MPRVLEAPEQDQMVEDADLMMTVQEEEAANASLRPASPSQTYGDLSDGGRVGDARLFPGRDYKDKKAKGRPAARRVWRWDGSESLIPLTWNPEGTVHDGGARYMTKRHCLCCHTGGFKAQQCPNCVKNRCGNCQGSTGVMPERKGADGKVYRSWIIRNYFPRKDTVPFPERFYGSINCFMPLCVRQGAMGFKTDQDMRMHARSRHKLEYQSYLEAQQMGGSEELVLLRRRVDELTTAQLQRVPPRPQGRSRTAEQIQKDRQRMADLRARRKQGV